MGNIAETWLESHRKRFESKRAVCRRMANEVDLSPGYLRQIAYYGQQPSPEILERIRNKHAYSSRSHPPTVTIRYEPGDPRRERALALSMEERRQALEEKAKAP